MKLPNAEKAEVSREKVLDYLLNAQHPDAAGKAKFFSALGFDPDRWQIFAQALRRLAAENDVSDRVESKYGQK